MCTLVALRKKNSFLFLKNRDINPSLYKGQRLRRYSFGDCSFTEITCSRSGVPILIVRKGRSMTIAGASDVKIRRGRRKRRSKCFWMRKALLDAREGMVLEGLFDHFARIDPNELTPGIIAILNEKEGIGVIEIGRKIRFAKRGNLEVITNHFLLQEDPTQSYISSKARRKRALDLIEDRFDLEELAMGISTYHGKVSICRCRNNIDRTVSSQFVLGEKGRAKLYLSSKAPCKWDYLKIEV